MLAFVALDVLQLSKVVSPYDTAVGLAVKERIVGTYPDGGGATGDETTTTSVDAEADWVAL